MANVFKQQQTASPQINRNNFDLSHQVHGTYKFGYNYPVLCMPVNPGESFRIDSAFGLKFMPMVFPVQTKMTAAIHFYYVRNKNLWTRWQDWISNHVPAGHENDKEWTPPYISRPKSFFKTGSLSDHLGVPTTIVSGHENTGQAVGSFGFPQTMSISSGRKSASKDINDFLLTLTIPYHCVHRFGTSSSIGWFNDLVFSDTFYSFVGNEGSFGIAKFDVGSDDVYISDGASLFSIGSDIDMIANNDDSSFIRGCFFIKREFEPDKLIGNRIYIGRNDKSDSSVNTYKSFALAVFLGEQYSPVKSLVGLISLANSGEKYAFDMPLAFEDIYDILDKKGLIKDGYKYQFALVDLNGEIVRKISEDKIEMSFNLCFPVSVDASVDDISSVDAPNPFSSSDMQIKISAFPYRAYESICNVYYRDERNDPFKINGQVEYNKYNTTTDGGADTTDYQLYRRNWELDYLTSCVQSPQQGTAPLVGMTALGNITIEDENGITTAKAVTSQDGSTIEHISITSPLASTEHARVLRDIASVGMSINDFRNVNAFQRWLEANIRKGYKYVDFVESHTGVRPRYKELDMPEFIGGFSRPVSVNMVTQSTPTSDHPLGDYAGQGSCFGQGNSTISHYCDDYGYIMGILTVYPTPAYSQLLPKHFLRNTQLDYHFPEFNKLGLQPVTYEEVCPVQAYSEYLSDPTKKLTDTFGYQRPNYDMVSMVDQIHGQFRLSMKDYLINRIYATRPELGEDFLKIDPKECNNVFTVRKPDNDVIVGQIIMQIFAKRPVPRVVIPSLE